MLELSTKRFETGSLFPELESTQLKRLSHAKTIEEIRQFDGFGKAAQVLWTDVHLPNGEKISVETLVNEFWTSKQRAANSLHEVSYRACFKPQLPRFFIQRFTDPGQKVHDPFMGRGTTPIEAALLGRVPCGSDANPISLMLTQPRLTPPTLSEIHDRLSELDLEPESEVREDLLVFYHPETLRDIVGLRDYFLKRQANGTLDAVDQWLRMMSMNRLTGHSNGFFSVYTLPPNQAVSIVSQVKINQKRQQTPPKRDVRAILNKKSKSLLREVTPEVKKTLSKVHAAAQFAVQQASHTPFLEANSVALVVTSPPFLKTVDYATDNWLRGWFAGIDPKTVSLTVTAKIPVWVEFMNQVFMELSRVLIPGGYVAFEVGEVNKGTVKLEDYIIPAGILAGLEPVLVMINAQEFTKTSHCWGVDNQSKGTNTNRIILLRKSV